MHARWWFDFRCVLVQEPNQDLGFLDLVQQLSGAVRGGGARAAPHSSAR